MGLIIIYLVNDNPLYIDNCPVQAITIKENKYDFEIIYDIDDEYELRTVFYSFMK